MDEKRMTAGDECGNTSVTARGEKKRERKRKIGGAGIASVRVGVDGGGPSAKGATMVCGGRGKVEKVFA